MTRVGQSKRGRGGHLFSLPSRPRGRVQYNRPYNQYMRKKKSIFNLIYSMILYCTYRTRAYLQQFQQCSDLLYAHSLKEWNRAINTRRLSDIILIADTFMTFTQSHTYSSHSHTIFKLQSYPYQKIETKNNTVFLPTTRQGREREGV